ncbi:roadblock/LC7 domain-containing protein [Acinetobacter sp. ANC 3813]|uniref:roadblock/LC7 domain-containing protein n=1 Tax=Acinetobacter sp. ANC 3813 TaxID=1977873 RepID=UPI000A344CCF|nr:hypothetical protein [Acinetobacter sp. ANC 3813]OTG90813.1 hypothetical protein B9T34_05410 [Acinetobacter sp. ANC 3813]
MFEPDLCRETPKYLIDEGKHQIQDLLHAVNGMHFVMLCSSDGFELASAAKKNIDNTGKIAAVGSSILAMVSAFVSEMQLTGCQTLTLDADNGKVILSKINHTEYPMLIVVLAESDVLIGNLLYSVKNAAKLLASFNAQLI